MPSLTGLIEPDGPVVRLWVNVSSPRAAAMKAANQPVPTSVLIREIIDTGASATVIDEDTILGLGLIPTGSVHIHTPSTGSTPQVCNQYDVSLWYYVPPSNHLLTAALAIIATDLTSQNIQALIGRDLLSRCTLIYNGPQNSFLMSF